MKAKKAIPIFAALGVLITILALLPGSPSQANADLSQVFSRSDEMIPMRDGVRLRTEFCVPKNAAGPLPFLITRTPYGISDDAQGFSRTLSRPSAYIAQPDIRPISSSMWCSAEHG